MVPSVTEATGDKKLMGQRMEEWVGMVLYWNHCTKSKNGRPLGAGIFFQLVEDGGGGGVGEGVVVEAISLARRPAAIPAWD